MDKRFESLRVECSRCVHYRENPHFTLNADGRFYCEALSRRAHNVHVESSPAAEYALRNLSDMPIRPLVFTPPDAMCWMFARKIDFPLEER